MSDIKLYDTLNELLDKLIEHFQHDQSHMLSESILQTLLKIQQNVIHIQPVAKDFIAEFAANYDVTPDLKANGYRSLLSLLDCLLKSIIQLLEIIGLDRSSLFFRANEYLDKLELYSDILHQFRALLYYAQVLIDLSDDGNLFLDEEKSGPLMHDCEIMAKSCFYGALHGFQYTSALQPVVHSLSTFVAQYNDLHEPSDTWTWFKSAINSGRYVVSPELRGEKLEQVYNGGDVEFFKRFWSLLEQGLSQSIPNIVGAAVQINRIFKIPPKPFTLTSHDNAQVEISIEPPQLFGESKLIRARLISYVQRDGQTDQESPSQPDPGFDKSKVVFTTSPPKSKSKNLIFFCHGGGFIALTSKSYEFILRDWSKEIDCPIFCVDYSLAPESPFPEAFEECFYAYAWALKNSHLLGTTAEKIVFVGDSAGGNLILSVALRAGVSGLRVPDHIVTLYPACIIKYSASPSRLMSVMDPLLPLGVLSACLGAYSGNEGEETKRRCSAVSTGSQNTKPVDPTMKPVKIKYISNLLKDVHHGFSKMSVSRNSNSEIGSENLEVTTLSPNNQNSENKRKSFDLPATPPNVSEFQSPKLTEEESHRVESSSSLAPPKFCVKLPHNFEPLLSKFCCDNFRMPTASSHLRNNSYLSPALADDYMMEHLPHVDIMACEFDPLFDDAVVLAKRLDRLNKSYHLHVAKGLPHGFLNFPVAKEAREASAKCLDLIKQTLLSTKL